MKTLLKSGLSLLILFAVVAPSLKAQKAKAEQVSYTYFRKALVATEEAKRTYSVEVNIPFAAPYN
ncbi:MAG: hypothetical protein HOG66_05765, partial [Flavobacteriales bacterium]|nr:hypothetical protein [Flavobacteriales bacterium]